MTIILIRHGETPLNRARVLQQPETPLSELGQQQAHAMAQRVGKMPLAAILSSDMSRAAQTAAPLSQTSGLPIAFSQLLHERNFGDLRSKRFDELGFDPMGLDYEPPNGESWPVFHQRVARAFELILQTREEVGGPLAVVSHGLVIREMLKNHLHSSEPVPERLENTCVTIVQAQAPYRVDLLGCSEHLGEVEKTGQTHGPSPGLV